MGRTGRTDRETLPANLEPSILERNWQPPTEEQVWAFPKSTFTDGEVVAGDCEEFMTDIKNIASNLRRKNNPSALGLDGIGYLMLKRGALPQLEFLQQIFKACIKFGKVPTTWRRSRTVFLFKKEKELAAPKNWRPITITPCIYRIFRSMVSEFFQHRLHKEGKRKVFSPAQKGFVSGIQGCTEHAVLTRELIAHAQRNEKNLYMVQIDFSDAFGSVPQGLIEYNIQRMGIPDNIIGCVMDIYQGCETVINVPTGESKPIQWTSGTVQGCPLSPALFNICLEPLLRELDRPLYKRWGFGITVKDGEQIKVNTAYADDLILYAERREGIDRMLVLLSQFCRYTRMIINVKKCVALAELWQNGKRSESDQAFEYYPRWESETDKGQEWKSQQNQRHYTWGATIAFNREDEAKHGKHVLTSMKERITLIWKSRLNVTQKMQAIKAFELPGIDFRMTCEDIYHSNLREFDQWLRA
jgi:hypothetical protein